MSIVEKEVAGVRLRVQDRIRSRLEAELFDAHQAIKRQLLDYLARFPLERTALVIPGQPFGRNGDQTITRFELLTYAQHLTTRHMASGFKPEGEGVRIELSDRGFMIFKNMVDQNNPKEGATGTPSNIGQRKDQVLESAKLAASAVSLLRPILRQACGHAVSLPQIVRGLAEEFRLPLADVQKPMFEGNHSLASLTEHSVNYLRSKGFLICSGKQYGGTPKAKEGILKGDLHAWEGFREPAPIVEQVAAPKKPRRQLDLQQVIGMLPQMDMPKTMALWQNATRVAADDAKSDLHKDARTLIDSVHAEWKRRSMSRTPETFRWPGTAISPSKYHKGDFPARDIQAEGMLGFMEYHVGIANGRNEAARRSILAFAFLKTLPPAFDPEYMQQWGANGSARRLQKIASSIASFCRNAKRHNDADFSLAIDQWEADLRFLRDNFYAKSFDFKWPSTYTGNVTEYGTARTLDQIPSQATYGHVPRF